MCKRVENRKGGKHADRSNGYKTLPVEYKRAEREKKLQFSFCVSTMRNSRKEGRGAKKTTHGGPTSINPTKFTRKCVRLFSQSSTESLTRKIKEGKKFAAKTFATDFNIA